MKITDGDIIYNINWSAINVPRLAEGLRGDIVKRTLSGLDKDDKPFRPYSTRPFKMPYRSVENKQKLKSIETGWAKQKGWIVIKGGYSAYKSAMRTSGSQVNLWMTGEMLKSFVTLDSSQNANTGEININYGFRNETQAAKALGNRERGRDIFGVTSKFVLNRLVLEKWTEL